jgi:hypothetical protein
VWGMTSGGGVLSMDRLLEEETTGHRPLKGEMKRMRRRIFSFFHLTLEGDKWRREEWRRVGERWRQIGGLEVEEDSVGPTVPNGRVTQAGKENFRKKKKKLNGPPGNFGPDWKRVSFGGNKEKKMGCSRNVGQNRHGLAREEFSKKRSWAAMDTRPN